MITGYVFTLEEIAPNIGFLGAGALVGFPHWYANQPDGFLAEVRPEGGAIPFEETLIGLPGGSIRGILSDPQP